MRRGASLDRGRAVRPACSFPGESTHHGPGDGTKRVTGASLRWRLCPRDSVLAQGAERGFWEVSQAVSGQGGWKIAGANRRVLGVLGRLRRRRERGWGSTRVSRNQAQESTRVETGTGAGVGRSSWLEQLGPWQGRRFGWAGSASGSAALACSADAIIAPEAINFWKWAAPAGSVSIRSAGWRHPAWVASAGQSKTRSVNNAPAVENPGVFSRSEDISENPGR